MSDATRTSPLVAFMEGQGCYPQRHISPRHRTRVCILERNTHAGSKNPYYYTESSEPPPRGQPADCCETRGARASGAAIEVNEVSALNLSPRKNIAPDNARLLPTGRRPVEKPPPCSCCPLLSPPSHQQPRGTNQRRNRSYSSLHTLGMKDHLRPEGKPAPPRPRRPAGLDLADDPVGAHVSMSSLVRVPVAALHRAFEERVVLSVQVGEDTVGILEVPVGAVRGEGLHRRGAVQFA